MENSKYRNLKQWFTFTFNKNNNTDLIYTCTNNHYIHTWFERNGHTKFKNVLNLDDYNSFIQAINESTNMIPDDFDTYFPDYFIEDFSLWNMDTEDYWKTNDYREHCKSQMEKLFNILWEYNDYMEEHSGILRYHVYYTNNL
jgi:hypothetical protein